MINEQDKQALKGRLANYLQAMAEKVMAANITALFAAAEPVYTILALSVSHRTAKAGSAFPATTAAMYSSWRRW